MLGLGKRGPYTSRTRRAVTRRGQEGEKRRRWRGRDLLQLPAAVWLVLSTYAFAQSIKSLGRTERHGAHAVVLGIAPRLGHDKSPCLHNHMDCSSATMLTHICLIEMANMDFYPCLLDVWSVETSPVITRGLPTRLRILYCGPGTAVVWSIGCIRLLCWASTPEPNPLCDRQMSE